MRRSIFEFPLKVLSKASGLDINFIKSRLFSVYIRMTGAKCSSENAMLKHNFTEHINILTHLELKRQIMRSGLMIEGIDFIYITPFFQRPFQGSNQLSKLLYCYDRLINKTPLKYFFLSGMVFKVRKP